MPDLIGSLARLHDAPAGGERPVPESAVSSDLRRGRQALRARRRRRIGRGALASAVLVAAGTACWAVVARPGGHEVTSAGASSQPAANLVDYHGRQLQGFSVDRIPEGYVLQGVSTSTLDIARPGDTSPLDSFVNKLCVSIHDTPIVGGSPVKVGRFAGYVIVSSDGTLMLNYSDGLHNVNVQSWSTIELTEPQLIEFATGVHISKYAVPTRG